MDYLKLPKNFYENIKLSATDQAELIFFNEKLAKDLGINLNKTERLNYFSGQKPFIPFDPIALAYSGHQFGHFVPLLGDGRAALIAQVHKNNKIYDIQLKGSGPTPFSRRGDGKSALGPVIKEYLVSEAMYHLGIPTTRALAAVATKEFVLREQELAGGIFTRVADGHIRIGTFEYAYSTGDIHQLKSLADYTIERFYPNLLGTDSVYLKLFQSFSERYLKLISKWMSVGFIHGVMNTDNCSLSGETIDYGPSAFMDEFNSEQSFSFIDRNGRYRYSNQPNIALWNLRSFAFCLIPLIDSNEEVAKSLIKNEFDKLPAIFENFWLQEMGQKLGIFNPNVNDKNLILKWLNLLQTKNLDFTNSFHELAKNLIEKSSNDFSPFVDELNLRIQNQNLEETLKLMSQKNPVYIPRNHLVEKAIQAAYLGDYSVFYELNKVWENPYKEQLGFEKYQQPPSQEERIKNTFCGT
jgi:uncharacterized protein YdiU (UPF0061 family)